MASFSFANSEFILYPKESNFPFYGQLFSGYEIVILQMEPGIFYISDFLGGWYDQRAGYGPDYAMVGKFELNDDNTITPLESYVAGLGDSMDQMTNTLLDPATGTLKWTVAYAGQLSFDIIVKQ
nr:BT_2262 family domain-containing protein [Bacteroides faecis]